VFFAEKGYDMKAWNWLYKANKSRKLGILNLSSPKTIQLYSDIRSNLRHEVFMAC
jgi:hypothetical protein